MPWEKFEAERQIPTNYLVDVISIRSKEIAISHDLALKYFKAESEEETLNVEIFVNKETGEIGLHPGTKGYTIRQRDKSSKRGAYIFNARTFLHIHPMERGRYKPRWDQDQDFLIIKVWETETAAGVEVDKSYVLEPEPEPVAVDFCPKCEELGFKNGVCPHCGYQEEGILKVTCPKGLSEPLEKEEEICRDCGSYKRAWGDRLAACRWDGWK